MTKRDLQFLIESIASELAKMLMKEYGWGLEKAMEVLYQSETFKKVEDERSGLFYQSDFYIFQFLKEEIDTTLAPHKVA
ncbi:MAG: hypothetical protein K2L03_01690 [Bacteroidales bacterium]|nr:hypothetical protein [Bacteroidales bacterium]